MTTPTLPELRDKIDALDRELLALLNRRAGLVFQWLKRQGGVAEMERRAVEKAELLYGYLDGAGAGCYVNRIDPACRSRMNVPFHLRDESRN